MRGRSNNYENSHHFPNVYFQVTFPLLLLSLLLYKLPNRELKQPRRRRQKTPHKFAYLIMKNSIFARLARAFFIFSSLKTFSFFSWPYDDKCSILSSYVPSTGSNLISGQLEHILSIMTVNSWKMIAEARSYISRWRSCFRRRRLLKLPNVCRDEVTFPSGSVIKC